MKTIVEIHSAAGGDDSKLFVKDLAQAYTRMFQRIGWISRVVLDAPGKYHIEVCGDDLIQLNNESGTSVLQRVPPTERKGRVHTSTVSVAVINTDQFIQPDYTVIDSKDLKIEWYSGTGCGGQRRNKVKSSCRLTHLPTNTVRTAQTRSRENSYNEALVALTIGLQQVVSETLGIAKSHERKTQMGSGMFADKVRTYRFQDNIATDHRTGKKAHLSKVLEGNFDLLW